MKARYFHIRLPNKPSKGGATVRVMPCKDSVDGDKQVKVQVAVCSNEDSFWRAMGRLTAKSHATRTLILDGLPQHLHDVQDEVFSRARVKKNKREYTDFSYTKKFFEEK